MKIILCVIKEHLSHFTLTLKKIRNKENDVRIKYEKKKKIPVSFERSEDIPDILDICKGLADLRHETTDAESLEGNSNRSDSPRCPKCHCKTLLSQPYLDAAE